MITSLKQTFISSPSTLSFGGGEEGGHEGIFTDIIAFCTTPHSAFFTQMCFIKTLQASYYTPPEPEVLLAIPYRWTFKIFLFYFTIINTIIMNILGHIPDHVCLTFF